MGVAAAAVLAIYGFVARVAWRLYRAFRAPTLAFATVSIATILVNGLFQEEALFAPLAMGFAMALAGLSFGSVDRLVGGARVADAQSENVATSLQVVA
jgi:hypothetical protein